MDRQPASSPEHPQGRCLDKGYNFAEVCGTLDEFGCTAHIHSRGEEAQAIKRKLGSKPVAAEERTYRRLSLSRRILIHWDKSPNNCIAFLRFACALIVLRAADNLDRFFAPSSWQRRCSSPAGSLVLVKIR